MGWCDTVDGCLNGQHKSKATNYDMLVFYRPESVLLFDMVEQNVETARPHGWSKYSVHGTKRIKEVIYG